MYLIMHAAGLVLGTLEKENASSTKMHYYACQANFYSGDDEMQSVNLRKKCSQYNIGPPRHTIILSRNWFADWAKLYELYSSKILMKMCVSVSCALWVPQGVEASSLHDTNIYNYNVCSQQIVQDLLMQFPAFSFPSSYVTRCW